MKRITGFVRWFLERTGATAAPCRCPGCGGPGGDAQVAAELRASELRRVAPLSEMCVPCRRQHLIEQVP